MNNITLTDEQLGAAKAIKKWFDRALRTYMPPFVLGGYAGTGKTTIIRYIVDYLGLEDNEVRYVAFTGKAAMVLRKKGLPATTIHSLIYIPQKNKDGKITFVRRSHLEGVSLIICDESSMIGKDLQTDLEAYGIPILYVGDHFQLPPVSKDQTNLMINPNYRLETIHRQALDNPIIRVAHAIRSGQDVGFGRYGETVFVIPGHKMTEKYLLAADQVICGFNKTRHWLNDRVRGLLEHEGGLPEPGDKLICLKNNHNLGLINGMLGKCQQYNPDSQVLNFISDDGVNYCGLDIDEGIFTERKAGAYCKDIEQFDFGYAVTCHKFQGSEAEKVLVYEELFGYDADTHRRWKYTAYTRASGKLIIVK